MALCVSNSPLTDFKAIFLDIFIHELKIDFSIVLRTSSMAPRTLNLRKFMASLEPAIVVFAL